MNLDLKEKYKTIKNALIIEKNEKLLEEFKNTILALDSNNQKEYLEEYKKYSYMALTLEEEQQRLTNIIKTITQIQNTQYEYKDDYKYITGEDLTILSEIQNLDKLEEYNIRLSLITECLNRKQELLTLQTKKQRLDPNNKKDKNNLTKIDKKEKNIIEKLKKENILMLLYEFCLIESFEETKINDEELINNLISSQIIKKEPPETITESINIEEPPQVVVETSQFNEEQSYKKDMIPEDMPILSQLGSVKPVTKMEKLVETQQQLEKVTIPSMGVLDNKSEIKLDSNEFKKNNEKALD